MINKKFANTLQTLAAAAAKEETQVSTLLSQLETLRSEIQESAKAELLTAASEWTAKVPTWDVAIHPEAEQQVIGKPSNVRFSKGSLTPEQGSAVRQAKKQSPKDLLLVLQSGKSFRTWTIQKDPGSYEAFVSLMPDMDDATRKTFQDAKDRYDVLKKGSGLTFQASDVTFLD